MIDRRYNFQLPKNYVSILVYHLCYKHSVRTGNSMLGHVFYRTGGSKKTGKLRFNLITVRLVVITAKRRTVHFSIWPTPGAVAGLPTLDKRNGQMQRSPHVDIFIDAIILLDLLRIHSYFPMGITNHFKAHFKQSTRSADLIIHNLFRKTYPYISQPR